MQNQVKLGDIFKTQIISEDTEFWDKLEREECRYFVLALAQGKRPNRVNLYCVNPQIMADDPKFKFREVWRRSEKVEDPNNITQEEWLRIAHSDPSDPSHTVIKVSEEEKAEIRARFKDGKIVADKNSFLYRFKFVPKNN